LDPSRLYTRLVGLSKTAVAKEAMKIFISPYNGSNVYNNNTTKINKTNNKK